MWEVYSTPAQRRRWKRQERGIHSSDVWLHSLTPCVVRIHIIQVSKSVTTWLLSTSSCAAAAAATLNTAVANNIGSDCFCDSTSLWVEISLWHFVASACWLLKFSNMILQHRWYWLTVGCVGWRTIGRSKIIHIMMCDSLSRFIHRLFSVHRVWNEWHATQVKWKNRI